jgi:proteasome lid subunit RPN8/RPN11
VSGTSGTTNDGAPAVHVRADVLADIVAHARAEWPNECCGLLIGRAGAIERSHRARNERHSPTRYLVSPEDHFAAIRAARALGLDVVGAYHSHPSSHPIPSASDLAEAVPGEFLYLIAGSGAAGTAVRGWRLAGGNFVPVALVTLS